jgi:hypothetical protein
VCVEDAAHWPQWEQPETHDLLVAGFLRGEDVGERIETVAASGA